ncbi:unnamed protein product [Anisakis simplex]|uniref:Uncharacterized protein n=1 Tax=Anisakis simplex TaxID=6269 RepID=A0A3P6N3G2_ANISI|nr:unnamed protein product [Anisakis simplex]
MPSSSTKGQQLATADESGQVETLLVYAFDDLEDIVNQLDVCGNKLLAACSDGTLGAYDLRNRKLIVRSEPMSSELLSITSTKKFTYVGNGDGYLEVFKRDEYGNILERIETPHSMGIDCVRSIRDDILLTSSNESPDIRLIHVDPNKTLGSLGTHEGGVQQLTLTNDHFWLISVGMMKSTVKFWNVPHLLDKIPIMRSNDLSKQKGKKLKVSNSFFDDLIGDEGEKDSDESNEDESESGNEDESVSDEEMYESEESANEGIAENSGLDLLVLLRRFFLIVLKFS